jgi:hypothetical protein
MKKASINTKKYVMIAVFVLILAAVLNSCEKDIETYATGTVVTFTVSKIPDIKQGGLFMESLDYEDDIGEIFSVTSLNDWFENASLVDLIIPEGVNVIIYDSDDESEELLIYGFNLDAVLLLILSVEGNEYNFGFGAGCRFMTMKTETGYTLLPEGTLKINSAPVLK